MRSARLLVGIGRVIGPALAVPFLGFLGCLGPVGAGVVAGWFVGLVGPMFGYVRVG